MLGSRTSILFGEAGVLGSSEDLFTQYVNGAQYWQQTHFLLVGFQKVAPGQDPARNWLILCWTTVFQLAGG